MSGFKIIDNNTVEFYSTTEKDGDLRCNCRYNIRDNEYTVSVWRENKEGSTKTKSWKRLGFEPRFGIDEIDYNYSYKIADELSNKFDKE